MQKSWKNQPKKKHAQNNEYFVIHKYVYICYKHRPYVWAVSAPNAIFVAICIFNQTKKEFMNINKLTREKSESQMLIEQHIVDITPSSSGRRWTNNIWLKCIFWDILLFVKTSVFNRIGLGSFFCCFRLFRECFGKYVMNDDKSDA